MHQLDAVICKKKSAGSFRISTLHNIDEAVGAEKKNNADKQRKPTRGRTPPSLLRISLLWLGSFQLRGGAAAGAEGWELGAVTSWCQNLHCGGPGKTWCFCGAQRRGNQVFLRRAAPENDVFLRRAAPDFHYFCNLLPKGVTFLVDRPCPGCHPEAWQFFFPEACSGPPAHGGRSFQKRCFPGVRGVVVM